MSDHSMCDHARIHLNRRELLARGLVLGGTLLIPGLTWASTIRELEGEVRVNGRLLNSRTPIQIGDTVTTGHNARIVFAVDQDVYLLRSRSAMTLRRDNGLINSLRLLSGKLMAVFGRGQRKRIVSPWATIGIRGTGVYMEVAPERTYFCTCYGNTELATARQDGLLERESIEAMGHSARYITRTAGAGTQVMTAPLENHSKEELVQLETYAGRTCPL